MNAFDNVNDPMDNKLVIEALEYSETIRPNSMA